MQQAEGQWNFVTAISEQEKQRGLCPWLHGTEGHILYFVSNSSSVGEYQN